MRYIGRENEKLVCRYRPNIWIIRGSVIPYFNRALSAICINKWVRIIEGNGEKVLLV